MESQPNSPEQPLASVTNLTEQKLREILDFDNNLFSLIQQGLWQQGIPPLSPLGRAIGSTFKVDELWAVVWNRMKTDHSEEEIARYVAVISKAQESIQDAFASIGKTVEGVIVSAKKD